MKASDIPMSEDALLRGVLKLAKLLGLRTAHFRTAQSKKGNWITPVQGDGKGWPDLTIIGVGGGLFRELKAEGKYPTPEQRAWLEALSAAGFDASWWRPRDLRSGRIDQELRAISRAKRQEAINA